MSIRGISPVKKMMKLSNGKSRWNFPFFYRINPHDYGKDTSY